MSNIFYIQLTYHANTSQYISIATSLLCSIYYRSAVMYIQSIYVITITSQLIAQISKENHCSKSDGPNFSSVNNLLP